MTDRVFCFLSSSVADVDGSGELDYEEFKAAMQIEGAEVLRKLQHREYRDEKGIMNVKPSNELYFGANIHLNTSLGVSPFAQEASQHFAIELYESRIASMERFVAFCVMFHQLGKRVQDFFPKYSLGIMKYKMERTHSIMRIATTASPVSGDAVRDMMEILQLQARYQNAAHHIQSSWRQMQKRRFRTLKKSENVLLAMDGSIRSLSSSGHISSRVDENLADAIVEKYQAEKSPTFASTERTEILEDDESSA